MRPPRRIGPAPRPSSAPSRPLLPLLVTVALAAPLLALGAGCDGDPATTSLDRAALLDPASCKTCHPSHYDQWAGSMHAYASEDPVFLAMNQRGQRETNGALGDFCVKCHAPMAVREGLTTDGLNLADLPAPMKGVTCYFCHAAESVAGTHDNPLTLAKDLSLFGPFGDPASGTPHSGKYAALFDDARPESSAACGACHDIVNGHGAHVERTFQEWQETVFSKPQRGLSCAACHMDGSDGPASSVSSRTRRLHDHSLPGVDVALSAFPGVEAQQQLIQKSLDPVVQSTLCFNPQTRQVHLTLDNVGAGHGWPSGASQDRRAWVQLTASAGGAEIYSSGGPAAFPLEGSADPDLWLIRDCMADPDGRDVHMFWEAADIVTNQLPGSIVVSLADPTSAARTHIRKVYPSAPGAGLAQVPDSISVRVFIQAIGDDVLQDLVRSGDLDASVPPRIARFEVRGAALDWTAAAATPMTDPGTGAILACLSTGRLASVTTPAVSHVTCPSKP